MVPKERLVELGLKGSLEFLGEMAKMEHQGWMARRVTLAAMEPSEKRDPTDFLGSRGRLVPKDLKEKLVIQERLVKQDLLESQVFLVTLVFQESGELQGLEE